MSEKKILVTSFDRFGGRHSNASDRALRALRERDIPNVDTHRLPVEFGRAALELSTTIAWEGDYDQVLMMGETPGVLPHIKLEQTARNRAMALMVPDNAGARKFGKIHEDSPRRLEADMQYDLLEAKLQELGIRTERSKNAGAFVCNELFYRALLAQQQNKLAGNPELGFMHIAGYREGSKAEGRLHDALPQAINEMVQ